MTIVALIVTLHSPTPHRIVSMWPTHLACERAWAQARLSALITRRILSGECREVRL